MKKINLIGMSVVAAGLLVSGCGSSSSSSSSDTGDAAINSIKQPIVIDENNTKITLGLLEEEFTRFGQGIPLKLAKAKANFKAVQEASFAMESGVPVESNCTVSGTETETYTYTETETGYTDEWAYVYDNCVESGSYGSIDGVDLNRYTKNGTQTYSYSEGYDVDTNTSRDSYSGADNYTQVYDNNETAVVSRTNTYQSTSEYKTESSGEEPYWNLDPETAGEGAFVRYTYMEDGMNSYEEVNASGDAVGSWKNVAENFSEVDESLIDESAGTRTLNGGIVYYSDGIAREGQYFDNYVVEWTRMNNEKTMNINGTAGTTCLNGSVSVQTTAAMKENQVDYFDGGGSTGSDVLPYTGSVSLTGANSVTADIVFDTDESNNTSATVTIGSDAPETYTYWSDLADDSCSFDD
jgi:hypothetical protein